MMVWTRMSIGLILLVTLVAGCTSSKAKKPYGFEGVLFVPPGFPRTVAVAPVVDLSGQQLDPLVEADIVFEQLGQVRGVTAVPVNRVAEVFAAMRISQIQTVQQAFEVCDALGVDAILVPTVTLYDPYDPPSMGASLALFSRVGFSGRGGGPDVRQLSRSPGPGPMESLPRNADFIQAAGVFDASAGSTRAKLEAYAAGRSDPTGPLGRREYLVSMDRYSAFVWHELLEELMRPPTP